MKKLYSTVVLAVMLFAGVHAQGVPQGMNYQAIARDNSGRELINRHVSLKISLTSPATHEVYYTESHEAVTNQFGLFNLIIGEGQVLKGDFVNVPWNKEEIFMNVAMQTEGEKDFIQLGTSKLFAVPYAFYAGKAGELATLPATTTHTQRDVKLDACPCSSGIKSINVLYLGPNGVTIKVYDDQNLAANHLLGTFTAVNNGAILTVSASGNYALHDQTFFTYTGASASMPVQAIPTKCTKYDDDNPPSVGSTFGNISVISQTDKNGAVCTACNVSGTWSLAGNAVLDACNRLGTLTYTDLNFVTNNITRLTITKDGDINLTSSLSMGQDLHVSKNVYLNETGGQTINNGPFTVANSSPTSLTGSLTVTGATQINNTLTVTGATNVNNTLTVAGATNVNNSFKVTKSDTGSVATFENTNNASGDGIIIKLGKRATKNNAAAQNADVALQSYVDNGLTGGTLANLRAFLDNDHSNDPDIVSLLTPAVDPNDALNLAQETAATACQLGASVTNQIVDLINNTIDINLATPINNGIGLPLNIGQMVNNGIGLPWSISDPINSALGLPIGLHIGMPDPIPNINIGTIVPALPTIEIPAIPSNAIVIPRVPDFTLPAIPHVPNICTALGPGLNIGSFVLSDVYVSNPLNEENKFVTFTDNTNWQMGAIKAQSLEDWATGYLNAVYFYKLYSDFAGLDRTKVFAQMKAESKELAQAYLQIGVEYSSGNGDYAEWLERSNADEIIGAGDIVGVTGGRITKELAKAEQVMAVSYRPIVLGNAPKEGKAYLGNNVAFMGQIPVKVMGAVNSGDYIVGKGGVAGYGIAVNPGDMTADDYKLAVGRSWDTNLNSGPKMVNTIVGVHNGDFIKILKKYDEKFKENESRMVSIENKLEQITDALPKPYAISRK